LSGPAKFGIEAKMAMSVFIVDKIGPHFRRDPLKFKQRRCQRRKEKTELSSAETGGGTGCPSLNTSARQLVLFETGE